MSAAKETYYVIGRSVDHCLLYEAYEHDFAEDGGFDWDNPRLVHGWAEFDSHIALKLTSRREAEEKATKHDGIVRRVTVTTEDVGLRWGDPELLDGKQVRTLVDGSRGFGRPMAQITMSPKDHKYRVSWFMGRTGDGRPDGLRGQWGDLDNAKAAAEAAVKATWT